MDKRVPLILPKSGLESDMNSDCNPVHNMVNPEINRIAQTVLKMMSADMSRSTVDGFTLEPRERITTCNGRKKVIVILFMLRAKENKYERTRLSNETYVLYSSTRAY